MEVVFLHVQWWKKQTGHPDFLIYVLVCTAQITKSTAKSKSNGTLAILWSKMAFF